MNNQDSFNIVGWIIKLSFWLVELSLKTFFHLLGFVARFTFWLLSTSFGRWLAGVLLFFAAILWLIGFLFPPKSEEQIVLRILYTNDEEGFLLGSECADTGGALLMFHKWIEEEKCTTDSCLILSGGDIFASSPISSLFGGESTIDVMNKMGYDALAVGNHEFDKGVEHFNALEELAQFPFLTANIQVDGTNSLVSGVVLNKMGIKIGVVGLTTNEIESVTENLPVRVIDTNEAVTEAIQILEANGGADIYLIVAHASHDELFQIVDKDRFVLLLGGHAGGRYPDVSSNERHNLNPSQIIKTNENWGEYVHINLHFNVDKQFLNGDFTFVDNLYQDVDLKTSSRQVQDLQQIINKWVEQTKENNTFFMIENFFDDQRSSDRVRVRRDEMYFVEPMEDYLIKVRYINESTTRDEELEFLLDAWSYFVPEADYVILNMGALRGCLSAGPVDLTDIRGYMPFNSRLSLMHNVPDEVLAEALNNNRLFIYSTASRARTLSMETQSGTNTILTTSFLSNGEGNDGSPFNCKALEIHCEDWGDWRMPIILRPQNNITSTTTVGFNNNDSISVEDVLLPNPLPQVKSKRGFVNVRSGPSTSHQIVGVLGTDKAFVVVGWMEAQGYIWYEVLMENNAPGWVGASVIEPINFSSPDDLSLILTR
jgi:5'-nucleotidase / UDP-sugar diphosphatase